MRAPWLISALLSFVAGYVDTVGFVALFSLFTAHVTGNFVLIGATLGASAGPGSGLLAKLLALPCFVLAVAVSTLALRRLQSAQRQAARWALLAQAVLVGGFMVVGMAAQPIRDGDAPLALLAGMVGVCAMAIQNTASRLVFADMAPSTVMTGNVTQLVIDVVDLASTPHAPAGTGPRLRLAKMWPAVAAFAAGAVLGGLGHRLWGFACLALPLAALGVAAMLPGVPPAAPAQSHPPDR